MWNCEHCAYSARGDLEHPRLDEGYCAKAGRVLLIRGLPSWCPLLPRWRSVKDEPPTQEQRAWMGWRYGQAEDRIMLGEIQIISNIARFYGPFYERYPSHWLPIDEWPLPPAPEE